MRSCSSRSFYQNVFFEAEFVIQEKEKEQHRHSSFQPCRISIFKQIDKGQALLSKSVVVVVVVVVQSFA
jgi:hypothetical protein